MRPSVEFQKLKDAIREGAAPLPRTEAEEAFYKLARLELFLESWEEGLAENNRQQTQREKEFLASMTELERTEYEMDRGKYGDESPEEFEARIRLQCSLMDRCLEMF